MQMWFSPADKLPSQNELVIAQDRGLNIHVCVYKNIIDHYFKEMDLFIFVDDMRLYDPKKYERLDVDWYRESDHLDAVYIDLWTKFPCIQPERSKREDLKCDNCSGIPRVFNCCWSYMKHQNNQECDDYTFRMRCSEHCGNTVRDK